MTRIRNWSGEHTWYPSAVHHPADEEEVATLVRRAAEKGTRLKAIGSALSWSDAAEPSGDAIRMDRMDRIVEIDAGARRARVGGGTRLDVLNEALSGAGMALDNFGSIVTQTVAGYLGTASHGTGIRTQLLSAHVEALRLVDGRGEVHELGVDRYAELFRAACAHLGALGVVTEVTLRCVDAFDLEERLELVDFDTVLADLPRLLADNDYLKLWWLPTGDEIQVYRFNKTDASRTKVGFQEWADRKGLSGLAFGGLAAVTRAVPRAIPFLLDKVQRFGFAPRVRVNRSDLIIPYSGSIPRHYETEYAIPVEQAAEALDRVRSMILAAEGYRVNFPFEVRFAAADDLPMSPVTGRDSCYLGAYVASAKWAPGYFADFEALMGDYRGRPHWGKTSSRDAADFAALYPDYRAFDRLRRDHDPAGVFRNPFVDRVFGNERGGNGPPPR